MAAHDPIARRLAEYTPASPEEEQGALKEILQEVALLGLSNAGFFEEAAFHGGTSLRIVHDLPRFSEDLDFALHAPNPEFAWAPYAKALDTTFAAFGIRPEFKDRHRAGKAVQSMWLKDNSLGTLLDLSFVHLPGKKLRIKLEVDTRPPMGAMTMRRFVNFPVEYPVEVWDLPSNFAGKLHANLCRAHVKGRDWFDFNWYLRLGVAPNLTLLSRAIDQQGPWVGQGIEATMDWLKDALVRKIESIDWTSAAADVEPFLKGAELDALAHWEAELFLQNTERLQS